MLNLSFKLAPDFIEKRESDYLEEPPFLCTLGLDIKMNRRGEPYVVEINGMNSGISGANLVYKPAPTIVRRLANLKALSDFQQSSAALSLLQRNYYLRIQDILNCPDGLMVDCFPDVFRPMPKELQGVADDKLKAKPYIDPKYRIPFAAWDGSMECISDFIQNLKGPYSGVVNLNDFPFVVAKGVGGAHGENVRIFHLSNIQGIFNFLQSFKPGEALLEAFIESKEIDGHHDGCMRYLIDFLVFSDLSWKSIFEIGYWRISPGEPGGDIDLAYKANLTGKNPAKPHRANRGDLRLGRCVVRSVIENLLADPNLFKDQKPL